MIKDFKMDTLEDLELSLLTELKDNVSKYNEYKAILENCLDNLRKCRKDFLLVRPRDSEYRKEYFLTLLLKAIEEENKARDKFNNVSDKLITIGYKLSETRRLLKRKEEANLFNLKNHQQSVTIINLL